MRDLFPGYYQHDPDALSSMMRSATVVLDSSALLNLYRYPSEARKDLLNVLKAISDRLWVPHHVAMEFQQNRATVIAEQMARFRDVKNVLERAEHNLNEDLNQLQLDKRHATIEPKRYMDRIHRAFNDFREELAELEKKQPDVHDVDQIRNALDSLFAGKSGPALTKNAFTQILQEGKERYQSKIPPGYMDTTKTEAGYFCGEFIVDKQYGDLVVWKQVIDKMREANIEDVLFVTDDAKEDWWWMVSSGGIKTLGPRPELVREIMERADVRRFWMYNAERFLQFASKELAIPLAKGSVETVRNVATIRRQPEAPSNIGFMAETAVRKWLSRRYGKVIATSGFPDFVCADPDSNKTMGFEVKYLSSGKVRLDHLESVFNVEAMLNNKLIKKMDVMTLVIVMPTMEEAERVVIEYMRKNEKQRPYNIDVIVGFMDEASMDFTPYYEV